MLKYMAHKEFTRALARLSKKGGSGSAAANKVVEAVTCWKNGLPTDLRPTEHGETRMAHVVKYALPAFHRLVVWEHAGLRVALFVGDHDDVDKWLNNHRGEDLVIDSDTQGISLAPTLPAQKDLNEAELDVHGDGAILDSLPADLIGALGLPDPVLKALKTISFHNVTEESTGILLEALSYPSNEIKTAIGNAIVCVATGQQEAAVSCLKQATGKAATAGSDSTALESAVAAGTSSGLLLELGCLDEQELRHILSVDHFFEWMLYLHPKQNDIVERKFNGPARLLGVSGSGKTCVLVHRAKALAQRYPRERILILTLSDSLARLIETLLGGLCLPLQKSNIRVMSIYDYCYTTVKAVERDALIERSDPRSGEDLAACWRDFYAKEHARAAIGPVAEALESRSDYVDPASYILDELIWIRSGFGISERQDYLTCDRVSRGVPFPKIISSRKPTGDGPSEDETSDGIPADARQRMLQLLADYEQYMQVGGLLDPDGVSLRAFSLRKSIPNHNSLRARCVLVDEVQDFSTVELAVVAEIPTELQDGLFLCGDYAQKVYPKDHNLQRAGIDIVGRGSILRKNYRNSRQILEAAYRVIDRYAEQAGLTSDQILIPEYAFRNGRKPDLFECATSEEEVRLLMEHINGYTADQHNSICVCSPREDTLSIVEATAKERGIGTYRLTGRPGYQEQGIRISTLENVKGHEFAAVFILDVDQQLPRPGLPKEEWWRDAFQLYVAMTRARDELVMMYVYNRSILLRDLNDAYIVEGQASDLL